MTDNDMLQTGLNYELLVEDALRSVVRSSLGIVEKVGLPGETHFYIGFSTTYKGVEIDDHLRAKHPENMTIVLQHQFADLIVGEDEFSVTLFFGGKPSPMNIPFEAVTSFNDPSVGFGLQFGIADDDDSDDEMMMITMTYRHQMISQRKATMMHLAIAPMLCRLTPFEKDRQNNNPMIGWQADVCMPCQISVHLPFDIYRI